MEWHYHQPVMLQECIEGLDLARGGVFVDATFGGGGHSKAIVQNMPAGSHLYGFDQDAEAKANAAQLPPQAFTFIAANFKLLKRYLKLHGVTQVNGILADLGVSSHQIDSPNRGFSTRFDGTLDMRMDQNASVDAHQVVNTYQEAELHKLLGQYGEVRNAKTLARAIVSARTNAPLNTTQDLLNVLQKLAPRGKEHKYYAQVFQAIRIEVNQELEVLESFLTQCVDVLQPGGRLVVMSYHSLEDRLVKRFFQSGNLSGEVEKDFYGNPVKPLEAVNKKPLSATEQEISQNPRARSARLRVATKLNPTAA